MNKPNGIKVVACPFCKGFYKRTNYMIRHNAGRTADGKLLRDTHQIACYRKMAARGLA